MWHIQNNNNKLWRDTRIDQTDYLMKGKEK